MQLWRSGTICKDSRQGSSHASEGRDFSSVGHEASDLGELKLDLDIGLQALEDGDPKQPPPSADVMQVCYLISCSCSKYFSP